MQIKYKVKLSSLKKNLQLEMILLYGLLLVTSWSFIMPSSWLDEVFIILLIVYCFAKGKKISKKWSLVIPIYIIWCHLGLLINMRINIYSLFIMIDNLKPIILLFLILSLNMTNEKTKNIFVFFELINFPSIIIGIINTIRYNYLHQNLLIESGTFKQINGIIIERAGGLIGHSGTFSEVCAVLFIYNLFQRNPGKLKWILSVFYAYALYCGRGRFPLGVSIVAIIWYSWIHLPEKWRKYLILSCSGIAVIITYYIFNYFLDIFALDFENQIRFVALRMILVLFTKVLFFGVGIGSIGNTDSLLYNYDLYERYGLLHYGNWDWESHISKCLIQTGIIGTVIWYIPFIWGFYHVYRENGKYKDFTLFLVGYFLINSTINKVYSLPFLVLLCILISNILNVCNKE